MNFQCTFDSTELARYLLDMEQHSVQCVENNASDPAAMDARSGRGKFVSLMCPP